MFNHRPLDLHYLVFCMALAEGLASLHDLSGEQRKMLSDGVKSAASKFNRRTLKSTRLSQGKNLLVVTICDNNVIKSLAKMFFSQQVLHLPRHLVRRS